MRGYIEHLLEDEEVLRLINDIKLRGLILLISGIITNGRHVVFVEYNVETREFRVDPEAGAYLLDEVSLRRIIAIVTSSWRRRFTAENLASDFGYRSPLAQKAVRVLYKNSPHRNQQGLRICLRSGGGRSP